MAFLDGTTPTNQPSVQVSDDARGYYMQSWTAAFFPGFMIFMSALSINLLGNGLRDALDPRLGE